ncbi:substrate-binding domain-containing protein [Jannaschia sp. S6380]|uniref:substrate-binding domain-containing protein n=1 Tax=Jannaschia sp. S6380 TaxID=2926408 RepID=UPI001FF1FC47|nr:substrate-binding domain-containing protein [Jannaschia sp. S6380]MCK0168175.1 substrate-binding domain-containing protein [Jannaschia sp. S6380]
MLLKPNTFPIALTLSFVLPLAAQADVFADRLGQTELHDASIEHAPNDGVVKLYGAGGPHTAFRQVADVWEEMTGNTVEVVAGPEAAWTADAQADADILWGTAEQAMTAFLLTYPAFDHDNVEPIYLRPAVIAVKAGNPLGIDGFEDLLADDVKIIVTEGAGVYNTSGTGVWEDVAGRLGRLDDIAKFRSNIVAYALGSGASYQQFVDQDADAWITWPNWPITKDDLEMIEMSEERVIYRDVSIVISPNADPEAQQFVDFLVSGEAQDIMATEGWQR